MAHPWPYTDFICDIIMSSTFIYLTKTNEALEDNQYFLF